MGAMLNYLNDIRRGCCEAIYFAQEQPLRIFLLYKLFLGFNNDKIKLKITEGILISDNFVTLTENQTSNAAYNH